MSVCVVCVVVMCVQVQSYTVTVTFNSIEKGMKLEFLRRSDDDIDDEGGDLGVKLDHQSNKQDCKVNKVKSKKRQMK